MKPISPQNSGGSRLALAHQHPPTTKDEARSRWRNFGDKALVQAQLLNDQYGLCCYSELRADLEGLGYHIEHIRPKSQFPGQTFDYTNLAASALSSDDLNTIKPDAFGGHAKRSQFDPALFISCHDADCARYFAYLSDGRIVARDNLNAADTDRANYTIALLNLNSGYLTNRRRRWYDELDQLFEEHVAKHWSLNDLAACDLIPSQQGLSPFFSLTRQFFGPIAEQALQQHAPQLV
ncbi:MAG: TIGR02646 family protein [Methylococcaceae bacterium]|nr:TIGR02646 family protein [Methylococcaceae bacterium]